MASGLQLRASGAKGSLERSFTRTPVAIGRNQAAHFVLRDELVSKIHAWIDIQQDSIYVRDVGSSNGTFVRGHRLEKNRWIAVGTSANPVQIDIGTFAVQASVYDPGERSCATLAESLEDAIAQLPPARVPAAPTAPMGAPAQKGPASWLAGTYNMGGPVTRLVGAYQASVIASQAFGAAIMRELESAPVTARAHICDEIVAMYPDTASDPRLRALLRRNGWGGPPGEAAAASPLAAAALDALQDLAGWYVGRERVLASPAAIAAFKENLRATLDEFVTGYLPLLAGVGTFEQQMAIQPERHAMPSSPARFAEQLLRWDEDTTAVRNRLRMSFAELMMHQVALLNGVMSGVKALLTELAPATIERAATKEKSRLKGLAGFLSRIDPWTTYKKRHSDLADEENERFRLLFGKEFVDEYRQFAREAKAEGQERGGLTSTSRAVTARNTTGTIVHRS